MMSRTCDASRASVSRKRIPRQSLLPQDHPSLVRFSRVFVLIIALLAFPRISSACAVCFGEPGTPIVDGANNAIWFMLAIIGLVQVGFVALFLSFRKRSRDLQRRREQFRLLPGGTA